MANHLNNGTSLPFGRRSRVWRVGVLIGLVLLLVGGVLFYQRRVMVSSEPELTFMGYSIVTGKRWAMFSFTNTFGMEISYEVDAEVEPESGWVLLRPNKPNEYSAPWVQPGARVVLGLPVPEKFVFWRARLDYKRRPLLDRLQAFARTRKLDLVEQWIPDPDVSRPDGALYSDTVGPMHIDRQHVEMND